MNSPENINADLLHIAKTYCAEGQDPDFFYSEMVRLMAFACQVQRERCLKAWVGYPGNRWAPTNGQRITKAIMDVKQSPVKLQFPNGEPLIE